MKSWIRTISFLASAALLAGSAGAQPEPPVLMLRGLDPVALIAGRETPGRPELQVVRGRFEYRFATAANRDAFATAPERYEVQRGGECTVMAGVPTDASIFEVYEGKIYAFGTPLCRERFLASPQSFLDPPARVQVKPRQVAILLFDGVELLDFAGPGEVFAAARTIDGQRAFEVFTVAATAEPITSQGFVEVQPRFTFETTPRPDIVVLPGGGVEKAKNDPRVIAWVKSMAAQGDVAMSVCTGAYFLAQAGLLDGKRATTHWSAIAGLRKEAPAATVVENVRFIDEGRIVTTAGVSAGIDGALHLVDRLLGRPAAQLTARYMEYEWRPSEAVTAPR